MNTASPAVQLRNVTPEDLTTLFEFQTDPEANRMAAFTAKDPNDRAAFDAHWNKILSDPNLIMLAVVTDGQVVGSIGKFEMFDLPQITYWIGKPFWGKGIATAAVSAFLCEYSARPLYASIASDNTGSRRVLEKCGFVANATDRGFANARGQEIDEIIFRLD